MESYKYFRGMVTFPFLDYNSYVEKAENLKEEGAWVFEFDEFMRDGMRFSLVPGLFFYGNLGLNDSEVFDLFYGEFLDDEGNFKESYDKWNGFTYDFTGSEDYEKISTSPFELDNYFALRVKVDNEREMRSLLKFTEGKWAENGLNFFREVEEGWFALEGTVQRGRLENKILKEQFRSIYKRGFSVFPQRSTVIYEMNLL